VIQMTLNGPITKCYKHFKLRIVNFFGRIDRTCKTSIRCMKFSLHVLLTRFLDDMTKIANSKAVFVRYHRCHIRLTHNFILNEVQLSGDRFTLRNKIALSPPPLIKWSSSSNYRSFFIKKSILW
jgi:hypothetical protein